MKLILLIFFLVCLALDVITAIRIKHEYTRFKSLESWNVRGLANHSAVDTAARDFFETILAAVFFTCLAAFGLIALLYSNYTWI